MTDSKKNISGSLFLLLTVLFMIGCSSEVDVAEKAGSTPADVSKGGAYFKKSLELVGMIEKNTDKLIPLAVELPPAKNGEWRTFWHEDEQSPQKYVLSMPSIVTDTLKTLYVKPVGRFSLDDKRIFEQIVEFLRINFQTDVVVMNGTSSNFPADAFRSNSKGEKQLSSIYITDIMLKEEMPDDAWGVLAVTPDDIYRAEGIDKQFGDSLLFGRRGVISLYHLKDGDATSLSLALKGASHEATHLLSIPHCVKYRCNMNGRITLEEFRTAPLHYSPDCLCKVIFATGADIEKRFSELIAYCSKNGLREELDYYSRAHSIIKNK